MITIVQLRFSRFKTIEPTFLNILLMLINNFLIRDSDKWVKKLEFTIWHQFQLLAYSFYFLCTTFKNLTFPTFLKVQVYFNTFSVKSFQQKAK